MKPKAYYGNKNKVLNCDKTEKFGTSNDYEFSKINSLSKSKLIHYYISSIPFPELKTKITNCNHSAYQAQEMYHKTVIKSNQKIQDHD